MKKFKLVALTAGAIISMANAASAEGPYYGPPPYYYGPPYSGPRPYRGGEVAYYRPGRHRTWNGCQRGWTVQDGLCKPYARANEPAAVTIEDLWR
jgi:hypothetical protein